MVLLLVGVFRSISHHKWKHEEQEAPRNGIIVEFLSYKFSYMYGFVQCSTIECKDNSTIQSHIIIIYRSSLLCIIVTIPLLVVVCDDTVQWIFVHLGSSSSVESVGWSFIVPRFMCYTQEIASSWWCKLSLVNIEYAPNQTGKENKPK